MRYDDESIRKGKQFEDLVEEVIFNSAYYDLVARTSTFEDNMRRYEERSMDPDFLFRVKGTGQEFYVEAKYRTNFNWEGKLDIFSRDQFERYITIHETGIDVFVVVGQGGYASNPDLISLMRIDEMDGYPDPYRSRLYNHQIEMRSLQPNQLNLRSKSVVSPPNQIEDLKTAPQSSRNYWILGILVLLILGTIGFRQLMQPPDQAEVRDRIEEYYGLVSHDDVQALEKYIRPTVERWYSRSNVSLQEIKKDILRYNAKYTDRVATVDWNTFEVEELTNGAFRAKYEMDYSFRLKDGKQRKNYRLLITSIWDQDLYLVSMNEQKLN